MAGPARNAPFLVLNQLFVNCVSQGASPLLLWIQYASCLTEDAMNANEIPDGTGQKPDCHAVM